MNSNDIKLSRLSNNLIKLSEGVASFSEAEEKHLNSSVANARNTVQGPLSADVEKINKKRAAVVSWDLGHNPAGRAFVLYELLSRDWDVDLIGPMWTRYGSCIWEPLRKSNLSIRTFHCADISDFVPKAEALVAARHYDIVYVCKPRLPSLFLGALIKEACDCPLVLDIDDFELSFFRNENYATVEELQADLHAALHQPFEELATRYSQTLIPSADAITVSNVALRKRFGGHIVRHARDEDTFRNSTERRESARHKLGISVTDFALIFIGTPRSHKGVLKVASALNELNDPDLVFHIVGEITDNRLKKQLECFDQARVVLHPNCSFDELPNLLAGADLVPLIQDIEHAICQYQIPAKVSDALSLGIPIVATCTPPLADLIASGAIHETNLNDLPDIIKQLKTAQLASGDGLRMPEKSQERRCFLGELGMNINRARLDQVIVEARANCHAARDEPNYVVSLFAGHTNEQEVKILPEPWASMVNIVRNHYRGLRGEVLRSARERRGENKVDIDKPSKISGLKQVPSLLRSRSTSYDMVYFWKQNDSNMYGRRSDMIVKGFSRSGRLGKLLHVDAPFSALAIDDHFARARFSNNEQQNMIIKNLVDRQMGIYDTGNLRCRTHVFSNQPKRSKFVGAELRTPGAHVRFVNEQMEEHGMRARKTVAWFCPLIWDAPELIEKIGFKSVIADLIDDQRAWDATDLAWNKNEKSYSEILSIADLVFANCDSLAEAMQRYSKSKINVVPNGAERFIDFPEAPRPGSLEGIKGPIVGYVGNLRDRIDWTLLHEIVPAMPDVSFVFFGPSNDNLNADSLAKYENVHVLGVVPYDELAFHLKAFDVGLVPHLKNLLTERMNPLKVYNYFAAGLPIVSSEVENLGDLGSVLRTASTAMDFVTAIRESLKTPLDTSSAQWRQTMDSIAWESRVGKILEIMDQSLHSKAKKTA